MGHIQVPNFKDIEKYLSNIDLTLKDIRTSLETEVNCLKQLLVIGENDKKNKETKENRKN